MSLRLKSEEAAEKSYRHTPVRILVFLAGIVFIAFVVYNIVSDNVKAREYSRQYDALVEQTNALLEENEQISRYLEDDANLDDYIEQIAREKLDFANPDERIYYIIPSSDN